MSPYRATYKHLKKTESFRRIPGKIYNMKNLNSTYKTKNIFNGFPKITQLAYLIRSNIIKRYFFLVEKICDYV